MNANSDSEGENMNAGLIFGSISAIALASAMLMYLDSLKPLFGGLGVILTALLILIAASPTLCRILAAVLLSIADGADAARRVRRYKRSEYLRQFRSANDEHRFYVVSSDTECEQ